MPDGPQSPATPLPAEAGSSRRHRWPWGLLLAAGLVWLWTVDPACSRASLRVACFHDLTGWHCPGCGSTRAAHALLNGRFGEALAFNPVFTLGLPLAGLVLVGAALGKGHWSLPAISGPAVLAGLLLFGVLRNVPGPNVEPAWPLPAAKRRSKRSVMRHRPMPGATGRRPGHGRSFACLPALTGGVGEFFHHLRALLLHHLLARRGHEQRGIQSSDLGPIGLGQFGVTLGLIDVGPGEIGRGVAGVEIDGLRQGGDGRPAHFFCLAKTCPRTR